MNTTPRYAVISCAGKRDSTLMSNGEFINLD